jgi:D-alanyl-D-alanine carboxypeptidase
MTGVSWRPGCPVGLDDLRLITLSYWGFDGRPHTGSMVVHREHAEKVAGAFNFFYNLRFPIARMQLVDDFGADDNASMAANNTSAFNCREVDGRPGSYSQHSYGWAIDINPVQNPWVRGGDVRPPAGVDYVDRAKQAPGMLHDGDAVVAVFKSIGWKWGGRFRTAKDYQHFSASGL